MKPSIKSYKRLSITQSKAKMYEYHIDEEHHIAIQDHPRELFPFTIAMLGDIAATYVENPDNEDVFPTIENLSFSARFFDSYIRARFDTLLDNDLLLLGAAAYYLGNLQGSSNVLLDYLKPHSISERPLKFFLYSLLKGDISISNEVFMNFSQSLGFAWEHWGEFVRNGVPYDRALMLLHNVREAIYTSSNVENLFYIDLIIAVMGLKYKKSSWVSLVRYSGLSQEVWRPIITKNGFIPELWPSQQLLGIQGVLKGESAVVQMPTSAGKTKSSELIIRSSFLAGRSDIALIVAPFRSLCHEIRVDLADAFRHEEIKISEISDVLQKDIDISELFGGTQKKILVLTPEKLLYILRQEDDLLSGIGLVIFDEGHQFDSGSRGITYELLLTSLRSTLPQNTQKILISAVISNAKDIGNWLNGEDNKVIKGNNISPTYKTLGFASWIDNLGQIKFVNSSNIDKEDFFLPRVLQKEILTNLPRERKMRVFPEKEDGKSIALYLGLKLVSNGAVAIFCGNKDTPNTIAEQLINLIKRDYRASFPYEVSDPIEIQRLKNLIALNLGEDALPYKAAELGVFLHHSRSPQGIRIAIESAMRKGNIKFIICTSTLAQGVNLPIRYLIVTSIYQGGEKLKVRDFHNLIGRAGRAGKHTEGSILFADPEIFDKRRSDPLRWKNIKNLMDANNAEGCTSTLLSIFDPFQSEDGKISLKLEILNFIKIYFANKNSLEKFPERIEKKHFNEGFTAKSIRFQLDKKMSLIASIQGFLMAHLNEEIILSKEKAISLCELTLAYYLANDEIKSKLKTLFEVIADDLRICLNGFKS